MKILLSFVFSGIVPIPSDMGSAVPYSQSGVIQFMCSQLIGLMIEDLVEKSVQQSYRAAQVLNTNENLRQDSRILLGYGRCGRAHSGGIQ